MANNEAPFHIVAVPGTLWTAAEGTTQPVVDAAPSGSWTKVGTDGALDYDESGVSVKGSQKITRFRSLGSPLTRKMFRTEQDLLIKLMVRDITLENLKLALNGNSITTVSASSGVAGYKSISLEQPLTVARYALLLRAYSPYGDLTAQYQFPAVSQVGDFELVYEKGVPIGVELTFEALKHASQTITAVFQTAAAS